MCHCALNFKITFPKVGYFPSLTVWASKIEPFMHSEAINEPISGEMYLLYLLVFVIKKKKEKHRSGRFQETSAFYVKGKFLLITCVFQSCFFWECIISFFFFPFFFFSSPSPFASFPLWEFVFLLLNWLWLCFSWQPVSQLFFLSTWVFIISASSQMQSKYISLP